MLVKNNYSEESASVFLPRNGNFQSSFSSWCSWVRGDAGVEFVLRQCFILCSPWTQPWPQRLAPRRASSTCRASSTRRHGSSSTSGLTLRSSRPCSSSPLMANAWGRLSTERPSTTTLQSSSIWRSVSECSGLFRKLIFLLPDVWDRALWFPQSTLEYWEICCCNFNQNDKCWEFWCIVNKKGRLSVGKKTACVVYFV